MAELKSISETVDSLSLTAITTTRTGARISHILLQNGQQFSYTLPDPLHCPYDVSGFGDDVTKQSFCVMLESSCQEFWRDLSDSLRDKAAKALELDPRDYHDFVKTSQGGHQLVKFKIARGHHPTVWWRDKAVIEPPESIANTRCRVRVVIPTVWIQNQRQWGFILVATDVEHHPDADMEQQCPF